MIQFVFDTYDLLQTIKLPLSEDICLIDHLGGFSPDLTNSLFDIIAERKWPNTVYVQYLVDEHLKKKYKSIDIKFSASLQNNINFSKHKNYNIHPVLQYKNFICSFNGSAHVSRKLLVAIMHRFGYFDTEYCSKNFVFTLDKLDGHIADYVQDQEQFYRKFFISSNSDEFFNTVNSFDYVRFDHANNIYNLENKLTQSFLHIVSETMATSYYPFVTEKFLYSVVTRGLFVAYAQPGWNHHLEKYYGFKPYTKLFDYRFDTIENPIERLVELMTMVSKFSKLSTHDWHDLYLLESDTVEYNYDWYFSKDYLKQLEQFSV